MTILSTALACFVSWQAIPSNPATLVKKPSISPTDIVIWDNNEMRGFLEAISDDWWAPKFVLAMTTGMRAGEVCGLSWQAVDLQNRALRVEKSMSCIRGTYDWSAPKSAASVRSIPLTNQAIAALQVARASDIATAEEWRFADLVFHRRNGMPLAPHNLSVNFRRVVERLGLPKIRLHDLRHSFASLLLRSGTDVSTVKDLMGHSTIRLTVDTYGHVLEDTKQAAMEKFDDSLAFS